MKHCETCKHWTKKPPTFWTQSTGNCDGLLNANIDIELQTGWDGGYIKTIETESIFGCTNHEPVQILV